MKRIAIDAMGGENAPEAIVQAVLKVKPELKETQFILFGDVNQLKELIPKQEIDDQLRVVPTTELIKDSDEPVKAIRRKKDSSLVKAAQFVKEGKADALLSLGNTGALLAASIFIIGRIKGVARPALMPTVPCEKNTGGFNFIDVGANAQSKPEYLLQWAQMASFYAEKIRGIAHPRVALLNNGSEFDKGDPLHKEAYQLLSHANDLTFIGNIEGNDLVTGKADVVVTDGFTGNTVLKTIEGTSETIMRMLKQSLLHGGAVAKLGALLAKASLRGLKKHFDVARAGGAVLIGVAAPVVKTHGRSDQRPIYYTLKQIDQMLDENLIGQYKELFAKKDTEN